MFRYRVCLATAVLVVAAMITAAQQAATPEPAAAASPPAVADPAGVPDEPEDNAELIIAQALDQPTSIELKDVPIRHAVAQIGEKTGVPMEVATGTVRFLPYGSETTVNAATFQDRPLREILTALLRPIGLGYSVIGSRLVISPMPPLERMARRATWQELDLLAMLTTRPWSEELFKSLKFQFQDSSTDDLEANLEMLRKLAAAVGAGSAAEVLEHATDHYGWTWYPAGENIVILSKPRQIERQLQRPVTLYYQQTSLKDALLDLGRQAGVLVKFDPGVLATLPSGTVDHFTFSIENATVRQALEVIAGQTGLSYFIERDGLRLTTAGPLPASTGQQSELAAQAAKATVETMRSNSIVGQVEIRLPGAGIEAPKFSFFLRENDLPPDLNEQRKDRLRAAVESLRGALGENSRTGTRPTD